MKTLFITLSLFFVSSMTYLPESKAQVPCGGVGIGIGPFGIGVVLDCPPPPPTVVVVRPRVRRPIQRRPIYVQPAPVRPRAQVPAPPAPLSMKLYVPQFTVGVMFDSSSYTDGGMAGGGVYGRFLLTPRISLESSISLLSSCTSCNPEAQREDSNFGIAALYYLNPIRPLGVNAYAKFGLLWKHVEFTNLNTFESNSAEQSAFEIGGGFEWRLSRYISINAEVSAMSITASEEYNFNHGSVNDHLSKGIPSANEDNPSINFKLGMATHF